MNLEIPTRFADRDWERAVDGGPLRFAVVGLGWFGRDVALPAIEDSDYCEATAVVSGSAEKASSVAEERGLDAALTYEEYADGEHAEAYDAVYVVTPNALHLPHVETAATLGKDVLCEKPLEATAERAERVVDVCEEAGVRLMTAYRMQTTRSVRWVRDQIDAGVIGDPVQFAGEFSFNMLAGGGDPDQWRLDPDLAGGGALMDVGVYPLNTARFVLDADPVAVHATAIENPPEFDGVDEHVSFTLEFPDDVTAQCTASYGASGANHMTIVGTDGRITVDPVFDVDADRRITIARDHGETTVDVTEPPEMVEEFDFFATAVLGDRDIGPDGRHGHFDLRVTEAVYESSDEGRRVDL
ncbi:Gfo/Idh/MocA family oxidoreductase [Halobacteria archaeon HArc-gm2]|nr:Gfo/Idh/MocA family oxidoreductase [Halobacteria archaeon HArc-gm2]